MPLAPGERRTCGCGTEFIGARVLTDPRRLGAAAVAQPESVMPFTLQPDPEKGNVLLQQIGGELRAIIFGDPEIVAHLRDRGVQLRVTHFADCPNAAEHRRRPTRPTEGAA